ncbi:hypothetical protein PZBJ_20335 [Pantoea endophytica]|uniref:Holin n=1 Tax=Pantoea endophytica TaxID=92488 RepID=A0ABX4SL34_9GAMM|nr:hypothetical protein [Pantoea endophytica]PLR20402.1 hypothetical protein PZBJ_20335 [Pantoea endophytica]
MTFLVWILIIFAMIIALLLIRKYTSLEFVAHAKLLFKAWSVWLASLGSMLSAWVQSFPTAALDAWSSLPPDVKDMLPHNYLGMIGAFMVAMGVIAQFIRQNKLLASKERMEIKS